MAKCPSQMTVKILLTVVKMVCVWIFKLLGFRPNNVSAILDGLEKTAPDVRHSFSFLSQLHCS